MDRHRNLDRDRDFLLHVYWIWVRDGNFNFLGDGDSFHVTVMMRFSSSETTATEGVTS
jgi:hypothetical protein